MAIKGGYPALSRQSEVFEFYGSFIGQGAVNGALVPTSRAVDSGVLLKYCTFTRTAAGKYTLQVVDAGSLTTGGPTVLGPTGVPVIITASCQIRSTNGSPVQIVAQPLVYSASAGTATFLLYNPSTLAAADPGATEFCETLLVASNAQRP